MKLLISADIEGISGLVTRQQANPGNPEFERFRRIMTQEVNAAIEGALESGASSIIVNDSHHFATNILIEDLNPAAELISGVPKPFDMMQGIGSDIDAVYFIGYHAAAGSQGGILCHTFTDSILEMTMNGMIVGETGFNAALAGGFNVPVKLVTGDLAVVNEAKTVLGSVETVAVKEGISTISGQCSNPRTAHEKIKIAAARALKRDCKPFIVEPPITVSVRFKFPVLADLAMLIPGTKRVDGLAVKWTGEDIKSVAQTVSAMGVLTAVASMVP